MSRSQTAWLVCWDWIGDHAAVQDTLITILNPRLSPQSVATFIETLYSSFTSDASTLASYVRQPGTNVYPATCSANFAWCGHNPKIVAKRVRDLRIQVDGAEGIETLSWKLPPLYTQPSLSEKPRMERGAHEETLVRASEPLLIIRRTNPH